MAYLRTNLPQSLLQPSWVLFSDDVNVEIRIDPLLDDLGSDSVVLLLLLCLGSYSKICIGPIYYIPDLYFLGYGLDKISPLRPILEVTEHFFLALVIVVFIHYDDNLEKGEKCCTDVVKYIADLIT